MLRKISIIILFLNLLCSVDLQSYITSNICNIHVGQELQANSVFIGKEKMSVVVGGALTGSGRFESPNINMKVNKFEFTGTIHCDGECHITTKEPFDAHMFTRSGNGTFIITVDPQVELTKSLEKVDVRRPMALAPFPVPRWQETKKEIETVSKPVTSFQQPQKETGLVSKKYEIGGITFTAEGQYYIDLVEAIVKDDIDLVMSILKESEIKENRYELGRFMMIAGLSGNIKLMRELIKMGADVNANIDARYGLGRPMLIAAILAKKSEVALELLKAGANPNAEDHPDWISALFYAVCQNDVDVVKALTQSSNLNINKRDKHGQTALIRAVHAGYYEIVEILLHAKADPTIRDWKNRATALDFAIDRKHKDIETLLRRYIKIPHNNSAAVITAGDNNESWLTPEARNVLILVGCMSAAFIYSRWLKH